MCITRRANCNCITRGARALELTHVSEASVFQRRRVRRTVTSRWSGRECATCDTMMRFDATPWAGGGGRVGRGRVTACSVPARRSALIQRRESEVFFSRSGSVDLSPVPLRFPPLPRRALSVFSSPCSRRQPRLDYQINKGEYQIKLLASRSGGAVPRHAALRWRHGATRTGVTGRQIFSGQLFPLIHTRPRASR